MTGSALLFSAALIWGLSFVAQSSGMESVGPLTFSGVRSLLGAFALLPVVIFYEKQKTKNDLKKGIKQVPEDKKLLIKGGLACGLALFFGSNLQQAAFMYTSVGKVGFLTALYIILVPIFGLLFKKKIPPIIAVCVLLACGGMYLLCVDGALTFNKGDLLSIAGAVLFAFHILYVDKYSRLVDCMKLAFLQLFISGSLSAICMFIFEQPSLKAIISIAPQILYAGIMSYSVAFTLQIIGQKHIEPAIASILLCLESVFALIFGWIILHQTLSTRELIGCGVMFVAIILAQLPSPKHKTVKSA